MRGEVLHYDEAQGFGFITGSDGNRYTFRREDLRRAFPLLKGTQIEFRESGGQARDIFSVGSETPASTTTAAAAPAKTAMPHPQHFGRFAVSDPSASTGLWSYFWEGITRNYANFRGRARRKEYWGYVLFFLLGLIALSLVGVGVDFALGNMDPGDEMPVATVGISLLLMLGGIIPGLAVTVRRFHDVGLSGWFYLLFFVLSFITIGGLIILVIALIPSQKRENKWGPVPSGIRIPPSYSQQAPAASTPGAAQ
jgi:uncharacterized membrane protein YhaH (DUF805 family)/cold shock CspA family protein